MNYQACKNWMLREYYRWRRAVPRRLLYHSDFFRVRRLLQSRPEVMAREAERRLRHVLDNATRHVPFYRRNVKLSRQEIAAEPCADLLKRFPYIGKAEVMDCQRDFLDERFDTRWLVYAHSHGSSGQGIGVWRTKREADIEKAFYTHEWGRLGFSFDKSRYLRIGADAARPFDEAPTWILGNRLMLSPNHIRPAHKKAIVAALNQFKPQYIHSYPSTMLSLAELLSEGDLDFVPRGVLLGSEPATPRQLSLLERLFHCPISISYGLTERSNLAFAHHAGGTSGPYLFQSLYGITENRLTYGHPEIVGTSLWNEVMPLIRYCTGDFGAVDQRGCCAVLEGRLHEFVVDRSGNRIPGLTIATDAATWDFVSTCQIRQRRPGEITLVVIPRHGPLTAEQKNMLTAGPRQQWGSLFDIGIDEAAELGPAVGGKRQFVVNELHAARKSGLA